MKTEKLSLKEKIGYSVGDTASNLYFQTFLFYLTYFYTDVFGLPAATVGTMFLITRIWDTVNDPLMGMLADRTKTRWGRFRPYFLWFALPFAIVGVLTFTTPDFDATGKLIYAYITYSLLMMLYTAVNVPYSALMGVLTPNSLERTEVSTFRFVAAFAGGLIVQSSTLALLSFPRSAWEGSLQRSAFLQRLPMTSERELPIVRPNRLSRQCLLLPQVP